MLACILSKLLYNPNFPLIILARFLLWVSGESVLSTEGINCDLSSLGYSNMVHNVEYARVNAH
jgi:hypothetical protein